MIEQLLPSQKLFRLRAIEFFIDRITVWLQSIQTNVACPDCHQPATRIHSRYRRKFMDVPWAGRAVRIQMEVRRFFCDTSACARRTFTEQLTELIAPFAHRTCRLAAAQRALGFALGGEAGARLAELLAMQTSPDTLLRLIRQAPDAPLPTPRVLGIDDWAFKKGWAYGTILIDVEKSRPIDLLPDRTADSLTHWLKDHPEVEIITRDRASPYAEAATHGAPQALQVADRFHLLLNLREALKRFFDRHQGTLRQVKLGQPATSLPLPENTLQIQGKTRAQTVTRLLQLQQARQAGRQARFEEAQALKAQGWSVQAMAQKLQSSRRTARRYAQADELPVKARSAHTTSKAEAFASYLQARWQAGCHSPHQLWLEIRAQGFTGSEASAWRWLTQLRARLAAGQPASETSAAPPSPRTSAGQRLSAHQAAWLFVRQPDTLKDQEKEWLEQFKLACEAASKAHDLTQQFVSLVKQKTAEALADWIAAAKQSGVSDLRNFAVGIQRDLAAVRNALQLPWSNGPTEGHIHRLKMIKRQMYGRAKFDLLRRRVLQTG